MVMKKKEKSTTKSTAKPTGKSKYTPSTPYIPKPKYHLSLGNSKIGKILNTNLLAGDDNCSSRVSSLKGSCTGCCSSCAHACYARKAYRYDAVIEANSDNLYLALTNPSQFEKEVTSSILSHPSYKIHRWHASGEIPSPEYFNSICNICKNTPNTQHYIYTKRYSIINDFVKNSTNTISNTTNTLPSNLTILFSPPFTCTTKQQIKDWEVTNNPYHFPLFIYDNHTDPSISSLPHCPAVDSSGHKTGITCDKCKRCITGKETAVYAH